MNHRFVLAALAGVLCCLQAAHADTVVRPLYSSPNVQPLPLRLPAPPVRRTFGPDPRITALEASNRRLPTYENYRQLAGLQLLRGDYNSAVAAYRTQATMFRQAGLTDAAIIQEGYAARYTTDARMFVENPATPADISRDWTRAVAEPPVGCYLGAFIDRDDNLGAGFTDEVWQTHHRPEVWTSVTGKAHGSLWTYLAYGRPAPMSWLRRCKAAGIVPQIAWEPRNMTQVRDNAYLRSFARQLRSLNWPVLLRFASEMNGYWTPYHANAELYRAQFRMFYGVIHTEAPNCAVIWCVANPPLTNIEAYYPGDDACDWVGVNFYAVPFYENNRSRPAFVDNPLTLLDAVYSRYAARKPIAICEFAASHRAGLDNVSRPYFAQEKMAMLYGALPLLYPRVKLVDWFSVNTIRHAVPGKTAGDYALTECAPVLQTYRAMVRPPWFLSRPFLTTTPLRDASSVPPATNLTTPPEAATTPEAATAPEAAPADTPPPATPPRIIIPLNHPPRIIMPPLASPRTGPPRIIMPPLRPPVEAAPPEPAPPNDLAPPPAPPIPAPAPDAAPANAAMPGDLQNVVPPNAPPVDAALSNGAILTGRTVLNLWVKTYTPRPAVYLLANNRVLYGARHYGPHTVQLDTTQLPPGPTRLMMAVYDDHNHFITAQTLQVTIAR